jgi:hypothetical protein
VRTTSRRRDGSSVGSIPRADRGGLVGRRGRGELRRADRQAVREDAGPREHRPEGDDLEQGEVDRLGDEEPGAGEEEHEDHRRRHDQAARHPVHHHGRGEQQPGEAEHHARGDVVVQRLVDVERHASHEGEVHADRGEEHLRDDARATARRHAAEATQVEPHAVRVHRDDRSREHQPAVEQRARHVAERAELAEVQVPPQVVGRGRDRQQDAPAERDARRDGEAHRGESVQYVARRRHGEQADDGYDGAHWQGSPPRTERGIPFRRDPQPHRLFGRRCQVGPKTYAPQRDGMPSPIWYLPRGMKA